MFHKEYGPASLKLHQKTLTICFCCIAIRICCLASAVSVCLSVCLSALPVCNRARAAPHVFERIPELLCRPVDKALKRKSKLPQVRNVWTVDQKLGGWAATQKHFFDEKVCNPMLNIPQALAYIDRTAGWALPCVSACCVLAYTIVAI